MRVPYCKRMQASAVGFLIMLLVICVGASAAAAAQQTGSPQQQPSIPAQPADGGTSSTTASQGQVGPADAAHPEGEPQQSGAASPPNPLGTAAAPKPEVSGVMGARPAGAAIAPGKQRRVRTILIKVGAVIGAGVALGTVAALSKSSPSRPH